MSSGIPFDYQTMNLYNAIRSPSNIHVKNSRIRHFFRKYLFQKCISVFKWKIPKEWDKDYFLYTLYGMGYIAVLNVPKYGTICQGGALGGYNLYYRPSYIMITNPLIRETITANIGQDCEIIKLMPDYSSVMDLIGYYADLMAVCAESLGINILNTKSATIFGAENKTQAESFKKMFDKVEEGEPGVVIGRKMLSDDGTQSWFPFTQDIKQSYVATDILSDMRKIEAMFDTDVGIPNANTDKRERLITDEVNANNAETFTRSEMWLEGIKEGIDKANKMFNIDIEAEWRIKPTDQPDPASQGVNDNVQG